MNNSKLMWKGKSQKSHFHIVDFWGVVVAICALGMQLMIFVEWNGKIEEYAMSFFFMSVIFYECLGKFIIRTYYVKQTCYELYADKVVITLKVIRWKYVREFNIKEISSIKTIKYKTGLGSIHFGDAETMYWNGWSGQYEGFKDNESIVVTTIGLFRAKNKWNSGIIYSIEHVEEVYDLLMKLRQNCKE